MRFRVLHVVAILACTLLAAGCFEVDSAREQVICFRAGSPLLNDDNTKSGGSPKESFANGDQFFVIGDKVVRGQHEAVFGEVNDPLPVSFNGTNWTYSPTKSWDPSASSYGFLAITGPPSGSGITCNPSAFPFSASLTYDPTVAQYDLMAACESRTDPQKFQSSIPVHMQFYHALSAVSVVVYNDSPEDDIRLISYGFKNLYTRASLTIGYQEDRPQLSWMFITRSDGDPVLGNQPSSEIPHGGGHSSAGIFDLMIPQEMDPVTMLIPKLVLRYMKTSDESFIETSINLKDILTSGSDVPITSWEQGTKYIYEIHIRYGGGIRVRVITTPWEEVYAGTPGLLI